MREKLEQFQHLDAQLLAVDPHEVWAGRFLLKETGLKTEDISYPLLLDPSLTVSATYGVAFQMRIHTELSNRPATFLIDKQGTLRSAKRGQTFSDRPSAEDVVAELRKW